MFLVPPAVARTAEGASQTRVRAAVPLGLVMLLLLLAAAAVALVWTARVGDIGARAVWNPNGAGLFPF